MTLFIEEVLTSCLGTNRKIETIQAAAGGDINQAYSCATDAGIYFVKVNRASVIDMFQTEALALNELKQKSDFVIPAVVGVYEGAQQCALVLEYIALHALDNAGFYKAGDTLARLHQQPQAFFGWSQDNYIGATEQINLRSQDWFEFFVYQRLAFQIERLNDSVLKAQLKYLPELKRYFENCLVVPSLLHGDLWSGNIAANGQGQPVIYDPASFYGDREMDLAMTELFGGFPVSFYQGYQSVWPVEDGYARRKNLYQLYHILNHANLFGGHYVTRARSMLAQALSE